MKTTFLLFTALLIGSYMSQSQTVTTFADGTPDDAIVVDASGNIYCSNYVGDTIFKFTPEGEVSSFITGLNTPNGLAFNSNQELFICDGQGNTIYKYDINGNLLSSYPIVGHPSGIVKSKDDESMIVTLYTGNKIKRLDTDGTITDYSIAAELNGPVGIAYDDSGDLYIGNYNDRKVYRVLGLTDLEYVAEVPTDGGAYPNLGFITYGQGKLWGTSMGSDKIYTINPNAVDDVTLFAGTTQGGEDGDISTATFNTPNGIYYDQVTDKLYVTDFGTKNLRIISGLVLGNDDSDSILGFQLVPNPIEDKFEINTGLPFGETYSVKVFDVLGKLIFQNHQMRDSEKISTLTWSKGSYLVQLKYKERWLVKQIVK